jgi:hypothetical protein
MSEHERKMRRQERNRESAREFRARKKAKVLALHQQLAKLETDNLHLRLQLTTPNPGEPSAEQPQSAVVSSQLEELVNQGASEKEIMAAIKELKERYSDYGRDRSSAFSFHLSQLKRCLVPTQTTRIILFLMQCAIKYLTPEGEIKYPTPSKSVDTLPPGTDSDSGGGSGLPPSQPPLSPPLSSSHPQSTEIAELLASLMAVIKPTREQRKQLVSLTSIYSGAPPSGVDFSDEIIEKIAILVTNKNDLLDSEMSNISSILSPTQIAKFILWIDENRATMQMLEALWPHLTSST